MTKIHGTQGAAVPLHTLDGTLVRKRLERGAAALDASTFDSHSTTSGVHLRVAAPADLEGLLAASEQERAHEASSGAAPGNQAAYVQTPPAGANTLANAKLAMAADPTTQAQLLAGVGGSEEALHQMNNAYQVGGQYYRPWLNALVSMGLTEPKPGAMAAQWASEGLGTVGADGKWAWAPGKSWDDATKSVY